MHRKDLQALVAAMLIVIQRNTDNRDGITRLWTTLQKMSEVISDQNVIIAELQAKMEAN